MRLIATLCFVISFGAPVYTQVAYSLGPTLKLGTAAIPQRSGDKFDDGQDFVQPLFSGGAGFVQRLEIGKRWAVEVETSFLRSRWRKGWEAHTFNPVTGQLFLIAKDEFQFDFYSFTIPFRLLHRIPIQRKNLNLGLGLGPSWYLSSKITSTGSAEFFPEKRRIETRRHYYSHEYDDSSNKFEFEKIFTCRMTGRAGFEINRNLECGLEVEMPFTENQAFYYPPFFDLGLPSVKFQDFCAFLQIIYWLRD